MGWAAAPMAAANLPPFSTTAGHGKSFVLQRSVAERLNDLLHLSAYQRDHLDPATGQEGLEGPRNRAANEHLDSQFGQSLRPLVRRRAPEAFHLPVAALVVQVDQEDLLGDVEHR